MLRNYIKATMGFERLGAATGASPKSLIRMFGHRGPTPPRASTYQHSGRLELAAATRILRNADVAGPRPLPNVRANSVALRQAQRKPAHTEAVAKAAAASAADQ